MYRAEGKAQNVMISSEMTRPAQKVLRALPEVGVLVQDLFDVAEARAELRHSGAAATRTAAAVCGRSGVGVDAEVEQRE